MKCLHCNKDLTKIQKKFCSRKCSCLYNSQRRKKYIGPLYCKNCNKELKTNYSTYCSRECTAADKRRIDILKLLDGEDLKTDPKRLRELILVINDAVCDQCRLKEWNDKPIPLDLHHIDGNAENNKLDNLQLLCCNCHAQTDNYGIRNKGKGRKYRYKNARVAQ